MLNMMNNPAAAYARVAVDTSVQEADPHQLILLLFDGAKSALALARAHLDNGDVAAKGAAISKAIDIVDNGLKASLDVEAGGELAANLAALYDYMVRRLLWANLKNDRAALEEVATLLGEIHGAWAEIAPGRATPAAA